MSFFSANIASHFAITEPSRTETPRLGLGEPALKFKLLFKDGKNNPATVFTSGEFVKLTVTCPNLEVQGVKDKYKPNSDGVVEVSGITLTPNGSGKVQYGRDQIVRVEVTGIEYSNYVTFPVKIKAGKNSASRNCLKALSQVGHSDVKGTEVLSEIFKRTYKRCEGPVLWAWLNFFNPKGYQLTHYLQSYFLFGLTP